MYGRMLSDLRTNMAIEQIGPIHLHTYVLKVREFINSKLLKNYARLFAHYISRVDEIEVP